MYSNLGGCMYANFGGCMYANLGECMFAFSCFVLMNSMNILVMSIIMIFGTKSTLPVSEW